MLSPLGRARCWRGAWRRKRGWHRTPYAVELRHLIRSLVRDWILPDKESAEYVEDEPPPRARPGTTAGGKKIYPEQILASVKELETGVKGQNLPEMIAKGIRKTTVVVAEPTSTANTEEEAALEDPMAVETEEAYLEAFDLDSSHSEEKAR